MSRNGLGRSVLTAGLAIIAAGSVAPAGAAAGDWGDWETQALSVAAGQYHTCALRTDSTVACWGENWSGESTPPAGAFTALALGGFNSCGLRTNQRIACWGSDFVGKSGPPAGHFTEIALGFGDGCGIRVSGRVSCWGQGIAGGLSPIQRSPGGVFSEVAVAFSSACGLRENGRARCWRSNDYEEIPAPRGVFSQLTAAETFFCGLRETGALKCWGKRYSGPTAPLRGKTFASISGGEGVYCCGYEGSICGLLMDGKPLCSGPAAEPDEPMSSISTGGAQACGIRSADGVLRCWSRYPNVPVESPDAELSQIDTATGCGLDTTGSIRCRWTEYDVPPVPFGTYAKLSGSEDQHVCGLDSAGEVTCWRRWGAVPPAPPTGPFIDVSAGGHFNGDSAYNCALRVTHEIVCWGTNTYGEIDSPGGSYASLSAGAEHTCALSLSGVPACWGRDDYDQSSPPSGPFAEVTVGRYHSCGLEPAGSIACWGSNTSGKLEAPAGTFDEVAAGLFNTCALRSSDRSIVCWGRNGRGESEPPAGTFEHLDLARDTSCALDPHHHRWCWGRSVSQPVSVDSASASS